jgi:hypothetical protein
MQLPRHDRNVDDQASHRLPCAADKSALRHTASSRRQELQQQFATQLGGYGVDERL